MSLSDNCVADLETILYNFSERKSELDMVVNEINEAENQMALIQQVSRS